MRTLTYDPRHDLRAVVSRNSPAAPQWVRHSRARRALILLLGATLATCGWATDYMTETLGTDLDEPGDLVLESPQVLSESVIAGGRFLLEVSAQLRNASEMTWYDAKVVARDEAANLTVELVADAMRFSELSLPSQIIQATTNLYTIISAADLTAARAELLSGGPLYVLGELPGTGVVVQTNDLSIDNPVIVSETPIAGGRLLIELAANVRNSGSMVYSNVTVRLDPTKGSLPYTLPVGFSEQPGLLGPLQSTTNLPPLYFVVKTNELESARSNVLSGAALTHSGRELWVFTAPPKAVDRATEAAWRWPRESAGEGATRLIFTNLTPVLGALRAGDLLVEDPGVYRLRTEYVGVGALPPEQLLPAVLPFEVSSVTVLSNEVQVVGRKRLLREVIRSATFVADALDAYDHPVRHPYNPTLENTYTKDEQEERDDVATQIIAQFGPRDGRLAELKGLTSIPWHFNVTNLSEHIKLSGEMLFRQSGVKLEIKVRDFQVQRATARLESGAILNLLIEADRGEDTRGKSEDQKSKELIPEDLLPAASLSLGGVPVTVQPVLSLKAGVEANIPTRLAVPLQSAFVIGMEMGFDRSLVTATNDGFFYDPYTQIIPLRVSDPSVFDDLAAVLEAWAEVGVGLKIGLGNDVTSLRAGPSVAARLGNTFTVAPLSNPWWSVDSGVDLIGRFTMDLSLFGFDPVELVDTEASLHHFDIFHLDAGAPLIGGGLPTKQKVRPVSGEDVRWGRLLAGAGASPFGSGFVVKLEGTSDVVTGGRNSLLRLNSGGDVLWSRSFGTSATLRCGVALPDGSVTVAGHTFGDVWAANFTPEGERNWTVTFGATGGFTLQDLVLGQNGQGAPEYYLVGHVERGIVTRSDPEVIKLDAAGQPLWARSYDLPGVDDEAHGGLLTSDGNLVISGYTGHPVAPPSIGTPDPANVLKSSCGLLMKVSTADGSLLWANGYPSRWGLDFQRIVEAPDGTLFAGGIASRIVTQHRPSNLFAKFKPDGTLLAHVTVGEDADWADELPNAGNTAYDNVSALVWTSEGLWACGTTGLGDGSAGWVMGLTEELGVRFYAAFDGPLSEDMLDLEDAGNGLAVLGNTRSSYPWGVGALPVPFVLKLPWEGIMRFHPDSHLGSLYLQPRVYKSSADLDFLVTSTLTIPGAGSQLFSANSGSVPFELSSPDVVLKAASPPPQVLTNFTTFKLEAVDRASVVDFKSWAEFHQLAVPQDDPAQDTDADGLPNYLEAYFNRNPWVAETNSPLNVAASRVNGQDTLTLQYDRAVFAGSFGVWLESSPDFQVWSPVTNLTQTVQTLDDLLEQVTVTAPRTEAKEFFRAAAEAP